MAERYDESAADTFDPAVLEPVVDFIAELAGTLDSERGPQRTRLRVG